MKIKWKELGARFSRVFTRQSDAEKAMAELRRDGIHAEVSIPSRAVARLKPKSKPAIRGGRGTSLVAADGKTIVVGETCFYKRRDGEWRRGTLEAVQSLYGGTRAWVRGKYLPWLLLEPRSILAARPRSSEQLA